MPEHQQTQQSKSPESSPQRKSTLIIQTSVSNPAAIIQRARIDPKSLTSADVLQLQYTIGNRAVARLLSEIRNPQMVQKVPIQRQKLEEEECPSCVQRQEKPEEEEPLQGKFDTIQRQEPEEEEKLQMKSVVQRQEISEEEDEPIQRKMIETVQRQEKPEDEEPLQAKRENNTGMPDNLKAGVESLSGIDISDVKVHYNSDKPAQIGALAYTQGTNIHVAPGQERYLPHEAWHVVQQKQGRVRPTGEVNGLPLNDSKVLESEADSIGSKALQQYTRAEKPRESKSQSLANEFAQKQNGGETTFQFVDNQPEVVAQRKLQEMANNSLRVVQLRAFQKMADKTSVNQLWPIQKRENQKFLSDNITSDQLVLQRKISVTKEQLEYANAEIAFSALKSTFPDIPADLLKEILTKLDNDNAQYHDFRNLKSHILLEEKEILKYRQSEFRILMIELGIFTMADGISFKEKMDLKYYDIDDLKIYLKGTRGLRHQNAMGNVESSFANMQLWLRPTITGRPKTLGKLEGKKMRFGKEPNHFLRVDNFQNGVMEFTIRTYNENTRKSAGKKYGLEYENGRSLFAKAMAFYKGGVKTIKAKWVSTNPALTDNLETYKASKSAGDSDHTAAMKTFTGKMAVEFGFTTIQGPTIIHDGVSFEFSKQ